MKPRQKKEKTKLVAFRAPISKIEKAIEINSNISECCNQGLEFFNMISSGEYEIKKK